MLSIAVRLAVASVRARPGRFVLAVVSIALVTIAVLVGSGAGPALDAQDQRLARRQNPVGSRDGTGGGGKLWWAPANDQSVPGGSMAVVAVAAEGAGAPVPPGLDRELGPGEAAVSPALRALLDEPSAPLRAWVAGDVVATIGRQGLHDPDELVLYEGFDQAELRRINAVPLAGSISAAPSLQAQNPAAAPIDVVAAAVAALALLPLLAMLRTTILADSGRRRRRLEALAVLGIRRQDRRLVAGVEGLIITAAGTIIGLLAMHAGLRAIGVVRVGPIVLFSDDLIPSTVRQAAAVGIALVIGVVVSTRSLVTAASGPGRTLQRKWSATTVLLAAGAALVIAAGIAGKNEAAGLAPRLPLIAGAALVAVATVRLHAHVLAWLARPSDDDAIDKVLYRSDLRATATNPGRGFAALVLTVFVTCFAGIAYPSFDAETISGGHAVSLATEDAAVQLPDQPMAREVVELLRSDPSIAAVLPVTRDTAEGGRTLGKNTINGPAADVAAAYDLPCEEACSGSVLSADQLQRIFNVDAHQPDLAAALDAPTAQIVLALNTSRPEDIGRIASAVRRRHPTATLSSRTTRMQGSPRSFSSQNLQSVGLVAQAMAVVALGTILLGSIEHLLSRAQALKHLTVLGMSINRARRITARQMGASILVALTVGLAVGSGTGAAYAAASAAPIKLDGRPVLVMVAVVIGGGAILAAVVTRRIAPILAGTSLRTE